MARAATTTDAFNAVAEPRRRQILDALAGGERPVNDLVERSGWPSHRCPSTCGCSARSGRWTCATKGGSGSTGSTASALKPIHDWVKNYERSWAERFDRLDAVLEDLKQKEEGDGRDDEQRNGEGHPPRPTTRS